MCRHQGSDPLSYCIKTEKMGRVIRIENLVFKNWCSYFILMLLQSRFDAMLMPLRINNAAILGILFAPIDTISKGRFKATVPAP